MWKRSRRRRLLADDPMWRFGTATIVFLLYVALANGIWISDMPSPGLMLYAGWALANLVSVMRVLQRRR